MKILVLEQLIKNFFEWFDKDKQKIFLFTFVFGIIANLLVMTADIIYADSIVFTDIYVANAWDFSLGRWALHYAESLRFGVSSAIVSSSLAIVYCSMMSVLMVDLFKIRNNIYKYLFGAILVCSPFFYEILFSTFCSSEFLLACLLGALAVYIVYKSDKFVKPIIISALLLSVSIGLYQAHIVVASSLCILLPIINILKNNEDSKDVIKKFFMSLLMGILGIVFYFIFLKIVLHVWGLELGNYSGANEIGIKNLLMLPELLVNAYQSFYNFFFTDTIINNSIYNRDTINYIVFGLIFLGIIIRYINLFKNKKVDYKSAIFLLFCIIMIPVGFCISELIAPDRDINQLMSSSFSVIYLFLLSLIEFDDYNNFKSIINWAGIISCTAILITYFVMSNASFMAVRITKEKTVNYISRIMDSILSYEEYTIDMPIMFAGNGESGYFKQRTNAVFNYSSGLAAKSPLIWGTNVENCNTGWKKLINYYLGTEINVVDYETHMKIMETKEFKKMGVYPDNKAIDIIDGVMVVKLDEVSSVTR